MIIFVLDLLTAAINLFSTVKSAYQPKDHPTITLEKHVHFYENDLLSRRDDGVENKRNRSTGAKSEPEDTIGLLVVTFIAVAGSIWLNKLIHTPVLILHSILNLVICFLSIVLMKKYTVDVWENLRSFYVVLQPIIFSYSLEILKEKVDFQTIDPIFDNLSGTDVLRTSLTNPVRYVPYALCHFFEVSFSICYALALILLIMRLLVLVYGFYHKLVLKLAVSNLVYIPSIFTVVTLGFAFTVFRNIRLSV